jgi:hypothetical protein
MHKSITLLLNLSQLNPVRTLNSVSTQQVSRLQFKKMVSPDFAQIMSLHAGEAYAMQNLTRTDRLGLLLSGKVRRGAVKSLAFPIFLFAAQPKEFFLDKSKKGKVVPVIN